MALMMIGRFHRTERWLGRLGRGLVLLGAVWLAPGVQAAPGAAAPLTTLTVALDDNYPPYIFRDASGALDGYLVDSWKLWERKTGVPVRLLSSDWNQAKERMQLGQAQVIDTIFKTPEREKTLDFTPAYAQIPVSIYTHAGMGGITHTGNLQGFKVGVKAGDACFDTLQQAGISTLQTYPSYEALVQAAIAGEVRIFCLDEPPAHYLLYKHHAEKTFNQAFQLSRGAFHRAVHKGDAATLALLNRGFAAISAAEAQDLHDKWMGRPLMLPTYAPYLGYALLAAALIGLLLLGWSATLRRSVRQRTAALSSAEAEQRRLNHALRLHSDCNMAMIRAKNEAQLLNELCRLVVNSGAYRLGWVGVPESDAMKSVHVVAQAGPAVGFLDRLPISWDAELPIGRGLMGRALRTGQTQVSQDCLHDPHLAPWHACFQQHGFQSCVVLPLVIEQQMLGALSLYAAAAQAFQAPEVQLLEELASDMAFGLQSLRARHELERSRQLLEQRVLERTGEIATLNTQLQARAHDAEAANRAKSAFLATMSHELRTPLSAVIGLTGLLADSPLGRRQRQYADKIQLAAKALRTLIDDILDFSRIEAGELHLEQAPFSLNEILRTTAAVIGVGLRDKPVEAFFDVAPDVPDGLLGDALRLQQILLNLSSNAVKFTPAGELVVSVHCLERSASHVTLQFAVRDTGIGIGAAQLGKIFEEFTQADASISRQYGGSGLGLAISARLANLMGGAIEVSSSEQVGSRFGFSVTLPVSATTTALPAIPTGLHLLIVDDHPLARTFLQQTSANFGWHSTAVGSAAAGLAELRRSAAAGEEYDLLLLDWRMPGMNGIEMLRQAFAEPDLDLPLVLLMASIFELEQAVAASDDMHLNGILAKPLTPDSLRDTVACALSGEVQGRLPYQGQKDSRLAGLHLLVVEDNELNQDVIGYILNQAGARLAMVASGHAAIEALRAPTARFDAVLMDIQMPGMDGYTATRIIREELGRTEVPIIALTAFARNEDREKSRLAGMAGHLVKPLDVEDLLDLVGRHHQLRPEPADTSAPVFSTAQPLPVLDVAAALEAFGGNAAKYQQLLQQFLERHGDDALTAARCFQAQDLQGASQLVHGLRGMGGLLQARELTWLAGLTEAALQEGPMDVVPVLLAELQAAMQVLQQAIVQFDPR
jgi:signal transduction histidine kinase/DNA-binding response OmpR family regulator/ABC-type amino acid transport substrate-binding protein